MTSLEDFFFHFSAPAFLVCSTPDSDLCNIVWRLASDCSKLTARSCRGQNMRQTMDLFNEFSSALQFPYYFGRNWPAFSDCLMDLSWLPTQAYFICITSAEQLLADDDKASFEKLVHTLQDVADFWAVDSPNLTAMRRKPAPFHILLQVKQGNEQTMLNKFISLGVSCKRVNL